MDTKTHTNLYNFQRGVAPTLHQFQAGQVARFQVPVRAATVEQYEQMLQRPQINLQVRQGEQIANVRMPTPNAPVAVQRTPMAQPSPVAPASSATTESSEQEIPDNVTAELEKLEQEGSMVELQGVGDIFGGLGDDDDELLGK